MSHFEALQRDGPARTGELRIEGTTAKTPTLALHEPDGLRIDDILLTDSGTIFHPHDGDIAPDIPAPLHAYEEVSETLEEITTDAASDGNYAAAVINGGRETRLRKHAAENLTNYRILVIGSAPALDESPRALVDVLSTVRTAARPDTAIYAPGAARPWTIPLLVYAGIDILDDSPARIAAARGTYFTRDDAAPAAEIEEPVCPCPDCRDGVPTEFEPLLRHNRAALHTAVAETRRAIRNGRTRELVERRIRAKPWLISALRHLDRRNHYLLRTTPAFRTSPLTAYGEETLRRVEITAFADRMHRHYEPPEADAVVILPCSAGKPYATSRSHQRYRSTVKNRAREIVLTSPMGAVPRELETVYPAAHYDIPVTGDWSQEEIDWMATNLAQLLDGHDYDTVAAHINDDGYIRAVEQVEDKLGIDITYTAKNDHPLENDNLARLNDTLDGHDTDFNWYDENARCVTDYLLGPGTGAELLDGATVRGRYPRLRVEHDGDILATSVPEYGSYAYTLDARHLFPPEYRVEIDAFVPQGSILAPGVIHAPDTIRPGDEVLVEGPRATCIGRAEMNGDEMTRSHRGIAVTVRHREEKQ